MSWLFHQRLTLPTYQHCFHPFLIKQLQKSAELSLKSLYWTPRQLFATYFFVAICVVCPKAIPEPFAHSRGIRLLATHLLIMLLVQGQGALDLSKKALTLLKFLWLLPPIGREATYFVVAYRAGVILASECLENYGRHL